MLNPISSASPTSGVFLPEEVQGDSINSAEIADTKDSIASNGRISTGFSYIKTIVISTLAIVLFSVVGFFVKRFSKDDDTQEELDETKKGKAPSEV